MEYWLKMGQYYILMMFNLTGTIEANISKVLTGNI